MAGDHVDDLNESGDGGMDVKPPRKSIALAVKPPYFSGQKGDPYEFFMEFDLAATANAWDPETFIAQFRAHLTGPARNWLTAATNQREREGKGAWDVDTLKEEFLKNRAAWGVSPDDEWRLLTLKQKNGESA